MKRIFIIIVILIAFFPLKIFANTNYKTLLNNDLNKYIKCFSIKDYRCMSSYILPDIMDQMGGLEGFINLMNTLEETFNEQGLILRKEKFENGLPSPIIKDDNIIVSIVPTLLPISLNGQEGVIKSSIIAISYNDGQTWYYTEGTQEGQSFLNDISAEIFKMINFPKSSMILNGETIEIN